MSLPALQDRQLNDMKYRLQQDGIHPLVPSNVATIFKRVLKVTDHGIGKVYRTGEHVTLRDTVDDSREWLMEISMFIVYGPIQCCYYFFVDGKYFVSKVRGSSVDKDEWTSQPIMVHHDFRRLCIHPLKNVPQSDTLYINIEGNNFLISDPDCLVIPSHIDVPIFPIADEIIRTKDGRLLQVSAVDRDNRTVQGFLLRRVGGSKSRWTPQRSQHTITFANMAESVFVRCSGCIQLTVKNY